MHPTRPRPQAGTRARRRTFPPLLRALSLLAPRIVGAAVVAAAAAAVAVEVMNVPVVAAVDKAYDPREQLSVGVLGQGRQVVGRLAGGEGDLVQRPARRHDGSPGHLSEGKVVDTGRGVDDTETRHLWCKKRAELGNPRQEKAKKNVHHVDSLEMLHRQQQPFQDQHPLKVTK